MRCGEKEQRLVKECERLRGHLVQIEESYTREALESEDREKQLRNKLAALEEKVLTSSSAIQSVKLVNIYNSLVTKLLSCINILTKSSK